MKTGKGMQKKALVKNQKGASVVEFAIILFVFLVFIFAVIEFGLLLFNTQMINNATREGARAGIVVRSPQRICDAEIETIVRNYCEQNLVTFGAGLLNIPRPLLREDPGGTILPDCRGSFGDFLTVTATFQYDWLFLSNIGIGPKTIQTVSRMRME
jgi:hypothetical protein